MTIKAPIDVPVSIREMRIDDVDSGTPRLTIDMAALGGPSFSVRLMPDAVRAIVDALAGVAEPAPGEVRVIIKARAEDLPRMFPGGQRYVVKGGEDR